MRTNNNACFFVRSSDKSVCYGCKDRNPYCHGKCERFAAEKASRATASDISNYIMTGKRVSIGKR